MANIVKIGATSGGPIVTADILHMSGTVRYVDSTIGDSSNNGLNRQDPFDSIVDALSASSANDIVVLGSNHAETLSAGLIVGTGIVVLGEGRTNGIPNPTITPAAGGITVNGSGAHFHNVKFAGPSGASTSNVIRVSGSAVVFELCYFECDSNVDQHYLLATTGADRMQLFTSTFVSTAERQSTASNNDPPAGAFEIDDDLSDVFMTGNTFSGGEIGFSGYAFDASAASLTRLHGENNSFILGADYSIGSASTGYFALGTRSGGVAGVW